MTTPITTGYGSDAGRTVDDMKDLVEDLVALLKEQSGGSPKATETLAADSFALADSKSYWVLTGQGGVADNLATITGGVNGREIFIRSADAANIITMKHGTGANAIRCPKGVDVPLKDGMVAHLRFDSALGAGEWECLGVYYANQTADERAALGLGTAALVNTGTGGANVPTITQADARYAAIGGSDAQVFQVDTPVDGNDAATKDYVDAAAGAGSGHAPGLCQFRLTTETGVPVSSADRTAQSTLYFTPMYGNGIGLKIAGTWQVKTSAEISLALSALTSGKNYDVFVYWDGAAVVMELLAWTNDTTRATALARDSGVWVKSGDATRLYVGTIRTTGTTTTEDSEAKRFVWNHFNQVLRSLKIFNTTNHSYADIINWRAWNNDAANSQIAFVIGIAGARVAVTVHALLEDGDGGVQIDASTSSALDRKIQETAGIASWQSSAFITRPAIGYHFIVGVEKANDGGGGVFDDLLITGDYLG